MTTYGGVETTDVRALAVQVTGAQAHLVADAIRQRDTATRDAALIVSVLAAGHVPAGATLVDVNVDTGIMTFHVTIDAAEVV